MRHWGKKDWGRKWLVNFKAGQTQPVSFDQSNNTGVIDVKMDASVLEEKSSYKMLGLTFSSKLDWHFYIISIARSASNKIKALIHSIVCFSCSCSISLKIYQTTMPELVLLVATWNCYTSYKNE